jgi:transposase-like protein
MIDPTRGKKGSYRTAWYMCHRIRAAMKNDTFRQLTGIVEVDETWIGGKDRNRPKSKRGGHAGAFESKTAVIGAIARKGNVVCQVVDQLDHGTMHRFVRKAVSPKVSLMATDEHPGYQFALDVPHETVKHGEEEYVRGVVHTQNIESFWSLLKRGIVGSYHNVSKKYLPLYVNEFTFRQNNRENADIFERVLASC